MPELPEVETVKRGISPHIVNQVVSEVVIRNRKLRFGVPASLKTGLREQVIQQVTRRAKYLLLHTNGGTAIIHLGMTGKLCIVPPLTAPEKHDHIDCILFNGDILRFTDPRRFGAWLWTESDPLSHPRLAHLGPEPLSRQFNAKYFSSVLAKRKQTIKQCLMDNKIVVGVGNIYAAESLFIAGVKPTTPAHNISEARLENIVSAIKQVLRAAIKKGGTTLKDFRGSDNQPGYFSINLKVYGREGLPCLVCGEVLSGIRLGGRQTVYCRHCQR